MKGLRDKKKHTKWLNFLMDFHVVQPRLNYSTPAVPELCFLIISPIGGETQLSFWELKYNYIWFNCEANIIVACVCLRWVTKRRDRVRGKETQLEKGAKERTAFLWRDVWKQQARKTTISVKDLEEGLEGGKNKSIIKDYKWVDLKGKGVNFGNFSRLQSKPKRT